MPLSNANNANTLTRERPVLVSVDANRVKLLRGKDLSPVVSELALLAQDPTLYSRSLPAQPVSSSNKQQQQH
jgi:hypothetical protein